MSGNEMKTMPKFESIDELIEFFETHDMGEYWEVMLEADFEIDIARRKHIFSLDEELAERLAEIARARQIPSKVLVITWLREKMAEYVA
jgi:hypothetical protein